MPGVTTAYQTGVHGSRPAASAGCILYSCTTHSLVYRSDGTSWTTWLTLSAGSSSASPSLTFSTSASAGAASTFVATDATIPIFDATSPSTQAFSDSAVVGTAAFAARRDHKHGMPASPGGGSVTRSTLGTTSAGSSFLTTRGTYVKKVTLASDGLLASIHAFVKGDGSYIEMIPVIFSDSSGVPTNLLVAAWPLVTSGGATLDAMALNTTVRDMSFGVGRWLVAGDYWIGINDYNGTAGLSLAYNSGTGGDYQVSAAATVKDSSIAAFSSTAHDWCIYADILR